MRFAAHCPPEREVSFDWPDAILFDWRAAGGARLAGLRIAPRTRFLRGWYSGIMLRAADMAHVDEVRPPPAFRCLNRRFGMLDTDAVIGSFARHLMTAFGPVERARV